VSDLSERKWPHAGVEQPWDVGEAVGASWRALLRAPVALLAASLGVVAAPGLASALLVSLSSIAALRSGLPAHPRPAQIAAYAALHVVFGLAAMSVFLGPLLRVALFAARGEKPSLRALAAGFRHAPTLFLFLVLYPLVALVTSPLLGIPARGLVLIPFFAVDQDMHLGRAWRASVRATRGHKGGLWLYDVAAVPLLFLGLVAGGLGLVASQAMYWTGIAHVYVRVTGRADLAPFPPDFSSRSLRALLRTTLFAFVVGFVALTLWVRALPVIRGNFFSVKDALIRVAAILFGVGVTVTLMATLLPWVLDLLEGRGGTLRSQRTVSGLAILGVGVAVTIASWTITGASGAPFIVAAFAIAVGALRLLQGLRTRPGDVGGASRFTLFVGARHIRAKKSGFLTVISILSIAGVAISSCSLSTVVSVMGGFSSDLKRKILGNNAHIVVDTVGQTAFTDYDGVVARVRDVPGVVAATPVVQSEVMISSSSNLAGVIVRGVEPDTISSVIDLRKRCDESSKLGERPTPCLEVGKFEYMVDPEPLRKLPPDEIIGIGPSGEPYLKGGDLGLLQDDLDPAVRKAIDVLPPLRPGLIIGRELSKTLHVYVGDEVTLVSPLGDLGPMGVMPRTKKFRIAAIFFSGMYEYDATHVYALKDVAQDYFGTGDKASAIEVKVDDAERADLLAPTVTAAVGREDLRVRDWREINRNLFSALKLERLATFVILSIAILVASFCIICTLLLMVTEKGKEIAILKSLGATDRQILLTFVTEGVIIGAIGTLFGVLTGLSLCLGLAFFGLRLDPNVYYIDRLPIHVSGWDFLAVATAALTICTLSTIYPAYAASKLRPVEGLRYE
jgi:lipoprotein-releasing system permease protein